MTISIFQQLAGNSIGHGRVLFSSGCIGLWAALAFGCGEATDNPKEEGTDSEISVDGGVDSDVSPCGPQDVSLSDADAEGLFDYPSVPTFDLYLPEADWAALQENARDEEYTEAVACFEGKSIGTVGLRFKGSYGSLLNCFNENNENICRKLSMKLKFDKYATDNRFFGLKRLNFQGYHYDDSYLKERLAYDLYRSMDIVAPRAAWANIRVNGELQGLFGMVEQIDGRFTADRWPDNGDQNLYKEAWPVQTDVDWLASRLETNEDIAEVSAFVDFSEAMLSAADDDLKDTLANFTDLNYFAGYMAVDDAVANFDGVTAYYTSADTLWSGNHNFYFYEEASDLFTIIPWDLESTFSIGSFGNVPHWTVVPKDCSLTYPAWGDSNTLVIAPGCDRIFRALASDLTLYRQAGQTLLDGPFAVDTMNDHIDKYAAFISDSVKADPHGPGKSVFENEVKNLKSQIPTLRERFSLLLSGEMWTPLEIITDGVTDFEEQDEVGLTMGPQVYINPNSTVSFSINTETPMVGAQDLIISFEFADEEKAWDQWLNYVVPLMGGTKDVRELSGIRMWIRADQGRNLRLELDNTYASSVNNWLREGWDIPASAESAQIEVLFQDAAIPGWATDQGLEPVAALDLVLGAVKGLLFSPQCMGRDDAGFLGDTTDFGFIEVDNIEFF